MWLARVYTVYAFLTGTKTNMECKIPSLMIRDGSLDQALCYFMMIGTR